MMTSDNIQCIFHIRVRETPVSPGRLFAAVGMAAGWGVSLVHGQQPQAPTLSGGSWSWQSPDLSGQIRKTQLGQDPAQSPAEGTVR